MLHTRWELLLDLDIFAIKRMMDWFGIDARIIMESEIGTKSFGTQRLIDLTRGVGADTYVSGPGGRGYMDTELFTREGVNLEFAEFAPVSYDQRFTREFVRDLSSIDMLFNLGPASGEFLRGSMQLTADPARLP